jgi:hypothetical protein
MIIYKAIKNVFAELNESIQELSNREYTHQIPQLSNATIGQHVRHVIEFFQELNKGYETGLVNYDKRKRNNKVEANKEIALELIAGICLCLDKPDKSLLLESSLEEKSNLTILIPTCYLRELSYNLEHTIHHMALIRIGMNEVSSFVLPDSFGVAPSSLKFQRHVNSNIHP